MEQFKALNFLTTSYFALLNNAKAAKLTTTAMMLGMACPSIAYAYQEVESFDTDMATSYDSAAYLDESTNQDFRLACIPSYLNSHQETDFEYGIVSQISYLDNFLKLDTSLNISEQSAQAAVNAVGEVLLDNTTLTSNSLNETTSFDDGSFVVGFNLPQNNNAFINVLPYGIDCTCPSSLATNTFKSNILESNIIPEAKYSSTSKISFKSPTLNASSIAGLINNMDAEQITSSNETGLNNKALKVIISQAGAKQNQSFIEAKKARQLDHIDAGLTFNQQDIQAKKLDLEESATFNESTVNAVSLTGADLTLNDSLVALTGDIKLTGAVEVKDGSVLKANNMHLGSGNMAIGSEEADSHGSVVLNNLDLNGNDLLLDPEFGQSAATLFVNNITDIDAGSLTEITAEETAIAEKAKGITEGVADTLGTTINGNIIIGRNAAVGLGGTESEFLNALKMYQDPQTKSLDPTNNFQTGALLYVNRSNIKLSDHKLIVSTEDIEDLKRKLSNSSSTIYLGTQGSIQVTSKAINSALAAPDGLVFSDLDAQDSIESKEGTLVIPSGLQQSQLSNIFGTDVQLTKGSRINVQTENGLFYGVIDSADDLYGQGDFKLQLSSYARDILSKVSEPTFDYYMQAMTKDEIVFQDTEEASGKQSVQSKLAYQDDFNSKRETALAALPVNASAKADTTSTNDSLYLTPGFLFLSQAGSEGAGQTIEQSARLASFGMSMHIANQVAKTTSDAINKHLNLYVGASAIKNTGLFANQGTTVWFSPTFQNYNSKDLRANNLSYSADVKLYGAVAGIDHTFTNGLRLGAAFNFGQGESEGENLASGVINEFSYYGFGLYASIKPWQHFTLSADISYNIVSSEIEADANIAGYNKISGSTNSYALSIVANTQYDFKSLGFSVSPHSGIRYTRLSLDSYDIKADGKRIGQTDTDTANILSFPLGVAFSQTYEGTDWIVHPRADFTITANIGSDSIRSQSYFDGVVGNIIYQTELMDSLTYGIDAGIEFNRGNFKFGANVGYTGSSNTDEIVIGANAHFTL